MTVVNSIPLCTYAKFFERTIKMTGKNSICSKLNSENGTVIIEATFVFPIMFIILFFLIFIWEMLFI